MRLLRTHRCETCGTLFAHYCSGICGSHFLCDDCIARRKAALKLPQPTGTADPYLGLPMTHDRDIKLKPSRMDEPHALAEESLIRGQAKVARESKNRALLKRWKKRA